MTPKHKRILRTVEQLRRAGAKQVQWYPHPVLPQYTIFVADVPTTRIRELEDYLRRHLNCYPKMVRGSACHDAIEISVFNG